MDNESLRNLRTMRQVRTSLDLARRQKARTANSLNKTEEPESPPADARLEQILAKERGRMAAYEASIVRSRRRLLELRNKLARVISRNQALTELRRELQESRWQGKESAAPGKTAPGRFREEVELRY